jgi:hypothetical protein
VPGVKLLGPPFHASAEGVLKRYRRQSSLVWLQGLNAFERYAALARHYCPHAPGGRHARARGGMTSRSSSFNRG